MSGDGVRRARALGLALIGLAASMAAAAEEPAPDAALLEYLGSWEGPDADWLLFQEAAGAGETNDDEEPTGPAGRADESGDGLERATQDTDAEESPESKDEQ